MEYEINHVTWIQLLNTCKAYITKLLSNCAVSGCSSTAYKRDKGISFRRFPLGNAVLLNFVMSLSFHSGLAQCAEPLATH